MSTIATVFGLILVWSFSCSEASNNDTEITKFPLNRAYGHSKSPDSVSAFAHKYFLYEFRHNASEGETPLLLDSVVSTGPPQLCDSNAVSFIFRKSSDSAMLMVKELEASTPLDTIISYPVENFGGKYSTGQGRLYNLGSYVYARTDSLLFWLVPYPTRRIWEVGRIFPENLYMTIEPGRQTNSPCFAGDFSMVLFTVNKGPGWQGYGSDMDLDRTDVVAYDLKSDSSHILQSIVGICSSPQLLHRDGRLFCICSNSLDSLSVCIVDDSIPRPLLSIEYPVSFASYELYQDSVVIRTANCCDESYGIQTHALMR